MTKDEIIKTLKDAAAYLDSIMIYSEEAEDILNAINDLVTSTYRNAAIRNSTQS